MEKSFVDGSDWQDAFLGNQLARLVDMIVDQGDALLAKAGLSFPSRDSSTILLISEKGAATTADIARELRKPHQLATQRVEALMALGLVARRNDPNDARRKLLVLTARGKKEAALLRTTLNDAKDAFQDLHKEIENNLSAVALQAIDALSKNTLADRIENSRKRARHNDKRRQTKPKRGLVNA